jgi:hypothetical protein
MGEGMFCTCANWQVHQMALAPLLSETPFHYCPWCGQPLVNEGRRDEALLDKYRQRIKDNFFTTDDWGMPDLPNMLVAARSIVDYRQLTGDVLGTLDLMLTFVEMGTQFTAQYGDIDEPFYEGLELMLDDFRNLLLANPHLYEEGDLSLRLPRLVRDAGWMGWGYGDYVTEQVTNMMHHFGDV